MYNETSISESSKNLDKELRSPQGGDIRNKTITEFTAEEKEKLVRLKIQNLDANSIYWDIDSAISHPPSKVKDKDLIKNIAIVLDFQLKELLKEGKSLNR